VPLPGLRSSLVGVIANAEAERLAALAGAALDAEIERRSHSILGKTRVEPGHGAFAMALATANRFAGNRVALVGEAAHLIPPIGAQGLNLGLRDAVTIAVDLLNRSLLSDLLAVQGLRGLGLYALDRIGPLRRAAMREGVSPHVGLPELMREERAEP